MGGRWPDQHFVDTHQLPQRPLISFRLARTGTAESVTYLYSDATMAASLASSSVVAIAAKSALPQISRGLLLRGGAVAAAAVSSALSSSSSRQDDHSAASDDISSKAASSALAVSGGETSVDDGNVSLFGLTITPEARATLAMVSKKRCESSTCCACFLFRLQRYTHARNQIARFTSGWYRWDLAGTNIFITQSNLLS